jgi:hypothetical protein
VSSTWVALSAEKAAASQLPVCPAVVIESTLSCGGSEPGTPGDFSDDVFIAIW